MTVDQTTSEDTWIVLGDVVDSRKITDREAFERKLAETLDQINNRYERDIVSDFVGLKGIDEIGGVLGSVNSLVDIQRSICLGVHPREIRLVVVRGEIKRVDVEDMREMDGTGFIKADDELHKIEQSDMTFSLSGLNPGVDELATASINMLDLVRNDWTERRVEIFDEFLRAETQKAVAEKLGITQQAVSAQLNVKSVRRVRQVESILDREIGGRSFSSVQSL